jgi:nucleotide-binding universal stress UspA family protein
MEDKILVCVDLKELSKEVLKKAIELGKKMNAHIDMVHIRALSPTSDHSAANHSASSAKELLRENKEITKLKELLRDSKLSFHVEEPLGDVLPLLLAKIKEEAPLFIVMGSEHNSAMHHFISGSLPGSILEKAKIPLLLVPRR